MNRPTFKASVIVLVGLAIFAAGIARAEERIAAPQAVGNGAVADKQKWSLSLPHDEHLTYHGIASFDEAGTGAGSMMYYAPSAAGLFASILAHGLVSESAKTAQKNKLQASADTVLSPYQDILKGFRYSELMERAFTKVSAGFSVKLADDATATDRETLVESTPVFSLTSDQTAFIVDNAIVIHMPGSNSKVSYKKGIRVVSAAKDVADPSAFWTANNGEKLKDESAQLVAVSLEIAFGDATTRSDTETAPYRTVRYREGAAEKIERAQLLSEHCGRMLIRTLRGQLMSVLASNTPESGHDCTPLAESTKLNVSSR